MLIIIDNKNCIFALTEILIFYKEIVQIVAIIDHQYIIFLLLI